MTDLGPEPGAAFTPADRALLALFDTAVDRLLGPRTDDGRGSLLVVAGPVGSGRTAALEDCTVRAGGRGAVTLTARCHPVDREVPGAVVRNLLGPRGAGTGLAGRAGRPEAGLADLLTGRPGVLVVDDAEHCDDLSAGWLADLVGPGARLPVVVLLGVLGSGASGLPDRLAARAEVVHVLEPLDPARVDAVVRARWGREVDDGVLAAVREVTGGNPLLLAGLLDLPEPPDPARVRRAGSPRLRLRLDDALRRSSRGVGELLATVAVLGEYATPQRCAALVPAAGADLAAARRDAVAAGLLVDEVTPRLRHPLVGSAALAVLDPQERRRLRLDAAALLAGAGEPSAAADVLHDVAGALPDDMVAVLRDAAERSLGQDAPDVAARHLQRALLAHPTAARRAEVLARLAVVERGLHPGRARLRAAQAVPSLQGLRERAAALCDAGALGLHLDPAPSVALLRRTAAEVAGVEDPDDELCDLGLRLQARVHQLDGLQAAGVARNVARLRELTRGGEPPLDTAGERERAAVLVHSAALAGALPAAQVAELARRILDADPTATARVHTPTAAVIPCLCMSEATSGLPAVLAAASGTPGLAPVTAAVLQAEYAAVLVCSNRPDEAGELSRTAYRELVARAPGTALAATLFVPLFTAVHDPDLARRVVADTDALPEVPDDVVAGTAMLRAQVAVADGLPADALRLSLEAGREFDRIGWTDAPLPWRSWAIELRRRVGDVGGARELSARELALARAWGAPARLGRALRTAGELHSGTTAVALLREAVEVLRQSSDRAEGRRAALALRRRTAGPVPVPPEDACGPSGLAGRPADRRHGLTPREYRTAELAAGGRTNPEIAAALGTSVRGVEKHLTRIYRKLGVAGRPALGRMWEEGSDLHR